MTCRAWLGNRCVQCALALSLLCLPLSASPRSVPVPAEHVVDVYLPLDHWAYPALTRLRGLGYLDTAFLGIRPWTRSAIANTLVQAATEDEIRDDPQAEEILLALQREFPPNEEGRVSSWNTPKASPESYYSRLQGISGLPLRDSFHLGQTLWNDYGRPYQGGFNAIEGASGMMQEGRFSLYLRGEYQHAPSAVGYSASLASTLSAIDMVPFTGHAIQATIPQGPIATANDFRVVEANLSYHLMNHQFSFGKSDHWLGPDQAGSFLYSNNAENIYSFQIDRTEPLRVPLLSRVTGPFRYVFFVGSLKGHTDPNAPWFHLEKISFAPTANVEIGFSRSTIWGGKGHAPITVHTFLKSFFSFQNVPLAEKISRDDPGARFGTFDFSWRLPFLRHWVTLYADSLVHDDVSPADAPRHAGVRPGIFLSEIPWIPRLDLRVEGVNTDPPVQRSNGGGYLYTEAIQPQGYTNEGFIIGDAMGREGKGGTAWLTYHISPSEMIQASFRNVKVAKDFVPMGTTQNSFDLHVVKRVHRQLEVSGDVQYERWKAPVYQQGQQSDTAATLQLTWFPESR